jgi:hypothetical protein
MTMPVRLLPQLERLAAMLTVPARSAASLPHVVAEQRHAQGSGSSRTYRCRSNLAPRVHRLRSTTRRGGMPSLSML